MGPRSWAALVLGVVIIGGLIWGGFQVVRINDELTGSGLPRASEVEAARVRLLSLGSFEEEAEGMSSVLVAELRTALEAEFGPIVWEHDPVRQSAGGCSTAESTLDGAISERSRSLGRLTLDTEQRNRASELVAEVAARHGFSELSTIVSGDGSQRVDDLRSPGGGVVTLVVGRSVGVSVTTDCRLTRDQIDVLRREGY